MKLLSIRKEDFKLQANDHPFFTHFPLKTARLTNTLCIFDQYDKHVMPIYDVDSF